MNSVIGEGLLPGEIEERLLRGFVPSGCSVAHGVRKQLAVRIRARCYAVDVALRNGIGTPLREIADRINVTERNLRQHFRHKEDLFAFPPTEIATALALMRWKRNRGRTFEKLRSNYFPILTPTHRAGYCC